MRCTQRIDIAATGIFHGITVDGMNELDLSYTPPLGSPWDAVQARSQAWVKGSEAPSRRDTRRLCLA